MFDTGSAATFLEVANVPVGTYFVRVRARNVSGVGPASNEVTIIVVGPCNFAGGAPTSLAATVIGSVIALNWVRPDGCDPDSYLIVVGSTPGSNDIARVDTGFPVESFFVSGVPPGTYFVFVRAIAGSRSGPMSNIVTVTVTDVVPPGTTTWTGLVANGDGVTVTDPECGGGGVLRLDITATLVQSGSNVTGIGTITVRAAPNCTEAVGISDTQPITGTVNGSLASGAGTFTATTGTGDETGVISGTFANGRMTGTLTFLDGATGTFAMNRQ